MQGAREGCAKLVYGAGRSLPAVVDDCYVWKISVGCRMTWSFGSGCRAGAKRPLCTFLSVSRKRTARRDPSRSTPRRVRRGSRRCPALFSSGTSSPRARYTDYYSLPPRSRPPHDRWRRCGATRTVFSPASAFGLTHHTMGWKAERAA